MSRQYKVGQNRFQTALLPPSVDDYISMDHPVRALDAYIDTLDLAALGFQNTDPSVRPGQPAFHPGVLLKLYVYGYLNRIPSSRRLEREAQRNLEVLWLTEGLRPGYKTIANFRKVHSAELKAVNKDFILLCKQLNLLAGDVIAIDGSFFKGNLNKDRIYTQNQLETLSASLEQSIADYQHQLAEQDAREDAARLGSLTEDPGLSHKIERLRQRQQQIQQLNAQRQAQGDRQIATVDPDARLLQKPGHCIGGYNGQIAVDGQHQLIIAAELTQAGTDSQQLAPMIEAAQEILQSQDLSVVADAGYFSAQQLHQANHLGATVYLPIPPRHGSPKNLFSHQHFTFDTQQDVFICPAGNALKRSHIRHYRDQLDYVIYKSRVSDCRDCPLRSQCLTEKARQKKLERALHASHVDALRQRMQQQGSMRMRQRRSWVEHPFATLKRRAGNEHFLLRGLAKCQSEFSLMTLAYNFTRVLSIIGVALLIQYCQTRYAL